MRTRFEGMTTDPSRNVHLYGIDINPATGATADRDWGSIGVDPGPPNGAVKGRWRFRPPCTVPVATDKKCVGPVGGSFLPPTREVRAVIDGKQQFNPDGTPNLASQVPGTPSALPAANGIFCGQYHAPIGEYIFPENVPGQPIPENNFDSLDFLTYGGYASFTGVQAGVLNPWPSNVPAPVRVCATPTIIGGPYTLQSVAASTCPARQRQRLDADPVVSGQRELRPIQALTDYQRRLDQRQHQHADVQRDRAGRRGVQPEIQYVQHLWPAAQRRRSRFKRRRRPRSTRSRASPWPSGQRPHRR